MDCLGCGDESQRQLFVREVLQKVQRLAWPSGQCGWTVDPTRPIGSILVDSSRCSFKSLMGKLPVKTVLLLLTRYRTVFMFDISELISVF